MTMRRKSSRSPACASSASARPKSASSERSWNSSKITAATSASDGSSRMRRVNTPSVTTSRRVLRERREPSRMRSPTVPPTSSPSLDAMRLAAARAASRRGSRRRMRRSLRPRLFEKRERHDRRLPRTGRRHDHGVGALTQRRQDFRQALLDRERCILVRRMAIGSRGAPGRGFACPSFPPFSSKAGIQACDGGEKCRSPPPRGRARANAKRVLRKPHSIQTSCIL